MSNSILRLRKIDNLVFGQNKVVENIEQLFIQEAPLETTNFQYQKMGSVIASVKVILPQSYQTPGGTPDVIDYNYACITQDGKKTYYYITAKTWLSTSALKLTLALDTLNSYCLTSAGVFDRSLFGERSTVKRAHKPRFNAMTISGSNTLIRRTVDPYPENLDVQLLTNGDSEIHYFSDTYYNNALYWYLVYLTQYDLTDTAPISATNPVLLTYCAFESVTINGTALPSITSINRSDPRLIKIIRIPYPPEDLTETATGTFTSTSALWETVPVYTGTATTYQMRAFKVATKNPASLLASSMRLTGEQNPLQDFSVTLPTSDITASSDRFIDDSKIFNSNFRYRKFIYDSFSWSFPAEAYKNVAAAGSVYSFPLRFVTSKNVNGAFAFLFDGFEEREDQRAGSQDFPTLMAVSRNNEVAIYNSDYLNYLKIGYNYDMKSRSIRATQTAAQLVLAGATAAASIALAPTGMGSFIALASGAAAVTATGISGIVADISAQNAIDQKIAQYQNQSVSVSGTDDSDILEAYGGNVLRERIYQTSVRMTQLLNDYFYFFGYSCLHYGIAADDVTGRKWFNFLQGDVELSSAIYTEEIREDIKTRLADGITILHDNSSVWDLEQKKENWEAIFNV